MDFSYYLKQQAELHPSMQMQDIIKMGFQSVFGVEHLLADTERARGYFTQEYEATPADFSIPLYEPLSDLFCRVNLGAWKARNYTPEDLFRLFVETASFHVPGTEAELDHCSESAERLIANGLFPFSPEEWKDYYDAYKKGGIHPVHHSDAYRLAEQPAYRLIRRSLLPEDII